MNRVILTGRLGADPDVRFMPSGDPAATMNLATNERFKNKEGEKVEQTEWHRVVTFGALATVASDYLAKGRLITVEGRLRTRKWEDKDKVVRYTTEVVAQRLEMLDSGKGKPDKTPAPEDFTSEEEIPF